jgi:hypothetical protein
MTVMMIMMFFVCFWPDSRPVGQGLLIHKVSRSHTTTHHSRWDSSGRMISPSQRPLPDNTQQSQQTSMPRWNSNPQSQQSSGRRPTSYTARPLGPAMIMKMIKIIPTEGTPCWSHRPLASCNTSKIESQVSITKHLFFALQRCQSLISIL